MPRLLTIFTILFSCVILLISASPAPFAQSNILNNLQRRTDPVFPDTPASCPICAKSTINDAECVLYQDYSSIQSCAEAAPVLANFTMVLFNPGAFLDVIKCACTETFQAVFPQCVDCFIQTGQEDVIISPDLPSVVAGMRRICAISSTLLGNVTAVNNASAHAPAPTSSALRLSEGPSLYSTILIVGIAFLLGCFSL